MPRINLNIDINTFNSIYTKDNNLFDYDSRFEVYFGSAGSGKSYFIACKLLIKALTYKSRTLVCRKYGSTLKNSVMQLFKDVLTQYKIIDYCDISDYNRTYTLPNGSQILFTSLDEESKLLSLQDISNVWVEETTEIDREIFDQLNLRMRGKAKYQQIFLSFNPISKYHWLYDLCVVNPPKSFKLIHSTYRDNKFLSEAYINALEELYITNARKATVYCDGQWASDPDSLVFPNAKATVFDIDEVMRRKNIDIRLGLDTGTKDASALIVSLIDQSTRELFIIQEMYKTDLTLDQLYNEIIKMDILKYGKPIYVDSADLRAINYLKSRHLKVIPAVKGTGSIEMGVTFLQNYIINIHPTCINSIKEFETYSYQKDKKTGLYIDGKYEKVYGDHAIDACRYSLSTIYTNNTIKILNKRNLGL